MQDGFPWGCSLLFPETAPEIRELETVGGSQGTGPLSPQTLHDLSAYGVPEPEPAHGLGWDYE